MLWTLDNSLALGLKFRGSTNLVRPKKLYEDEAFSRLLLLLLLLLPTAIELSLGGGSPYISTDTTKKNIHKQNKKHSTNNAEHSKYKYIYITKTPTHYKTHTLQKKVKQPQYKFKQTQYKTCPNEIVTIQSSTLSTRPP